MELILIITVSYAVKISLANQNKVRYVTRTRYHATLRREKFGSATSGVNNHFIQLLV